MLKPLVVYRVLDRDLPSLHAASAQPRSAKLGGSSLPVSISESVDGDLLLKCLPVLVYRHLLLLT